MNNNPITFHKRRGAVSKKPFYLIAAGAVLALLSSCGDNVVESYNGPISTEATLNVVVRDNTTGDVVPGATVTLLGGSPQSASSNSVGTVTFDNVYVGSQKVRIVKAGYTTIVANTSIFRDNNSTDQNVYIANQNTIGIYIYPMTSSLDGYLYYSKDGKSPAAAGAEVRFTLDQESFENKIITATTDEDGKYRFDGLPAVGVNYTLTAVEKEFDGTPYQNQVFSGDKPALLPDANAYVKDKFEYNIIKTPFIYLGSSPITVARDQAVVLSFSDVISTEKTVVNPVSISPRQPVDVTYNGKTLTITPKENWNATGGLRITIGSDLISENGNAFGGETISVNVISQNLSDIAVTGLVIDSIPHQEHAHLSVSAFPHAYSNYVNLKWKKITGKDVDGYEVFYKKEGEKFYQPVLEDNNSWLDFTSNDSLVFATVRINGYEAIGRKTNTFVVQAYNTLSYSTLVGADTVVLQSRPTLTAVSGAYSEVGKIGEGDRTTNIFAARLGGDQTSFENWLYSALANGNASERKYTFIFTEPMDNSKSVLGSWVTTNHDRIIISADWGDPNGYDKDTKLTVTVTVNPGTAAVPNSNTAWVYRFNNDGLLKSRNGQDFFIEYTTLPQDFGSVGITKVIKSTLDIKIRAAL